MIRGVLIGGGTQNEIFDVKSANNRDNSFYPFGLLKQKLGESNIDLVTVDCFDGEPDFVLVMNYHHDIDKYSCPKFLLLMECKYICPENYLYTYKFDLIFSWDTTFSLLDEFVKINFSNPIKQVCESFDSSLIHNFFDKKLACMISGNKRLSVDVNDGCIDLYKKRVEVIRWFEKEHCDDFSLYGAGWDLSVPSKSSLYNKYYRRIERVILSALKKKSFPLSRGPVKSKNETLSQYKFTFCFENVYGINGYITEKIFDGLMAGCVPIYFGAPDIGEYVPHDTFIDFRDFPSLTDLYKYMTLMDEEKYNSYVERGQEFLRGPGVFPFTSECFADTLNHSLVDFFSK